MCQYNNLFAIVLYIYRNVLIKLPSYSKWKNFCLQHIYRISACSIYKSKSGSSRNGFCFFFRSRVWATYPTTSCTHLI